MGGKEGGARGGRGGGGREGGGRQGGGRQGGGRRGGGREGGRKGEWEERVILYTQSCTCIYMYITLSAVSYMHSGISVCTKPDGK